MELLHSRIQTAEENLPCDRCAEHQIHINQLLERAALTEDLHIKEMDTLRERLRAMQEENREREAECEGLKREQDDLLKKLEGHQLQPSVSPQVSSVMMSLHTIIAGIKYTPLTIYKRSPC